MDGEHAFTSLLDACSNIIAIFDKVLQALDPFIQGIENLAGDAIAGLFDAMGTVLDKFNEFADWILGNTDDCDTFAVIVGSIATAILLVVSAITLWNVVGAIASGVTTALGVAVNILTSPITLVILAIAALIAIVVLLYKNWDTISEALTSAWEWLKEKAIEVFTAIGDFFSGIWEAIKTTITTVWNAIKDFFSSLWEGIKNIVFTVWNGIVTGITTYINTVKTVITTVFNAIKDFFSTVWNAIKTTITNLIVGIYNGIVSKFNAVKSFVTNVFTAIKTTISNIWNNIKTSITNVITNIVNGVKDKFNGLKNSITTIFTNIKNSVVNLFNNIKTNLVNIVSNMWTAIKDKFSSLGTAIGDAISGAVKSAINWILEKIESVINSFFGLINSGIDVINNIPGVNIGKLNMLTIPKLAKGGIVNQPTQAIIGERGKEAVLPLENNTEWMDTLAEKIATLLSNLSGNDRAREFTFNFNGTLAQLIRLLKIELDKESERRGDKLIIGGKS